VQHAGAQHVLAGAGHARLADGLLGELEGLVEAFEHLREPHALQQDGKTALVLDLGETHRALALVDLLAKGVGIVTLDQIHDCWLLSATVPLSLHRRSGNRPRHARISAKPGRRTGGTGDAGVSAGTVRSRVSGTPRRPHPSPARPRARRRRPRRPGRSSPGADRLPAGAAANRWEVR